MVQGLIVHNLPYEIECRQCGCFDVEIERLPTPGEWFPTGRARCNECLTSFTFRHQAVEPPAGGDDFGGGGGGGFEPPDPEGWRRQESAVSIIRHLID